MSLFKMLYDTYENCSSKIGIVEFKDDDVELIPLLPINHTTQNANVEICINEYGNFISSRVITDKKDSITIIPCTEKSTNRSSGPIPHPLFDKLQYVAGDYLAYGGEKKKFCFEEYLKNLEKWCNSEFSNSKVKIILKYVKKRSIISDLISSNILIQGENGKLLEKWNNNMGEKPEIFKVVSSQLDSFVRFKVQIQGDPIDDISNDKSVWNSFNNYLLNCVDSDKNDICYVTGEKKILSKFSPSKIRHTGDKAKLISGNDSSNFTYRGRFRILEQAVGISKDVSQKAHNALKWLIARQGIRTAGGQVYLAFSAMDETLPPTFYDSDDLICSKISDEKIVDTKDKFAHQLKLAIAGYKNELSNTSNLVILGLNAATTGRLSIIYYREFIGFDLIDNLNFWHSTCVWRHTYKKNKSSKEKIKPYKIFIGAPSPKDIIFATYGLNAQDDLQINAFEKLIPCIIDRAPIPKDIFNAVYLRASNPVSMEPWEHRKTLTIACAVICKYYNDKYNKNKLENYKEVYTMALNKENMDKNYLFGRLLAYANRVESYAQYESGEKARQTNAERMMHQFSLKPVKTWEIINDQLNYYFKKMNNLGLANKWKLEISAILSEISFDDFKNERLKPTYLLGYDSQITEFENERKAAIAAKGE